MRQVFSSALRPRQALLLVLEGLLFANELAYAFLLVVVVALVPGHWDLGIGWAVPPLAALLLLNTWTLAWFAKTRHFAGAFARWPCGPAKGLPQAEEHALLAAEGAFDQGRFDRVPDLMERLPEERRQAGHWLALGRALALRGRMEEALAALEKGGEHPRVAGYLKPRRGWGGREAGPYFDTRMPGRFARIPWMAALVLGLLLITGSMAAALATSMARQAKRIPSFDATAFQSETLGRLTIYYHDEGFKDQVAPIAEAALDHDLGFLAMSADTFGPGAVKIYLCDSEAEYRRRAPTHPSWEAACAEPPQASIYIHRFPDQEHIFFEVVLAHELGHLCYYRMAGSSPDDWLNEGLADYLGYDFGLGRAGIPKQAWLQDHYFKGLRSRALPFDLFFRTDPHLLPNAEVATFYQQGFSVVYLLVEDYGREPFLKFLRECADRKDINTALAGAFPTIPTISALAAVWTLFYPAAPVSTPGT